MTPKEIKQLTKEGALEALAELGLAGDGVVEDIKAIRGWLDGYRLVKRTAIQTTIKMLTLSFWILMIGGVLAWLNTHLK